MAPKRQLKALIDSPTRRSKLRPRREPYWHKLQKGGYIGYRRTENGGSWIARWRNADGKERYKALKLPYADPAKEFEDAQQSARAWFIEQEAGIIGRWTVKEAAAHYVDGLRLAKGDRAASDAQGRINRCIVPQLGRRPLERLKTSEIEEWRNGLVPKSLDAEATRKAKDSANRNLTTFKALLNKAWRSGRVMTNDAWKKVQAFADTRNARKVFLTPEQRKRLLAHCQGGFKDLLEAALLTGARYGELAEHIFAGDYDTGRRILSIRGGKTGPRDIPVSDAAHTLFCRLKARKLPLAHMLTRDDGKPWGHSDQDDLMREVVKKARLPAGTVFYTLRHTHIASALTGGISIHQVAKLCGTSVRMIELHYDKFLHGDAHDKLNKVAFL